ncbi:MAG: hypothetical protein MR025_07805 [Helicobacter trogontum]|nr:hypothetical protein [Helicobacter trogontum]
MLFTTYAKKTLYKYVLEFLPLWNPLGVYDEKEYKQVVSNELLSIYIVVRNIK